MPRRPNVPPVQTAGIEQSKTDTSVQYAPLRVTNKRIELIGAQPKLQDEAQS